MLLPLQSVRGWLIPSLLLGIVPLTAWGAETPKVKKTASPEVSPRTRTFQFTYQTTVMGLTPGKTARIWLPVPPSTGEQEVKLISKQVPGKEEFTREEEYGNKILFIEAQANQEGVIPIALTYRVIRHEVKADFDKETGEAGKIARFLEPDNRVPVGGKSLELLKDKKIPKDQLAAAQLFYNIVNDHMRYSKEGTGWGRGDSNWACDSGYGNCTDFHSLFISLARSQKIPAKFEIGFPLPEKRGEGTIPGYHCWAKFRPFGMGWIPVDISEANKNPKMHDYYFGNLTENRVAFSTGRDITLVPKQDGEPLNFFVYPYVEVDTKVYPAEKVKRLFSFKDLEAEDNKPN